MSRARQTFKNEHGQLRSLERNQRTASQELVTGVFTTTRRELPHTYDRVGQHREEQTAFRLGDPGDGLCFTVRRIAIWEPHHGNRLSAEAS